MENSMEALKKIKINQPYNSTIPLLGTYSKDCKSAYNNIICITMFIAALFIIAKLWKQSICPHYWQMD
jgi:hypothetical protein